MKESLLRIIDTDLTVEEKALFTEEIIQAILYNLKEDSWELGIESIIEFGFSESLSTKKCKTLSGKIIKGMEEIRNSKMGNLKEFH